MDARGVRSLLLMGVVALLSQVSSELLKRQEAGSCDEETTTTAATTTITTATTTTTAPPTVCQIELQAWGFDDSNGKSGYIKVGGATVIVTTRTTTYSGRGFFVSVVNFATCSASGYTNYDVYGSAAAATTLAKYLQGLSANTIIAVVTADSVNSVSNTNLAAAVPTLKQIGIADAGTLDYRGKLAFVAQIGNPSITVEGLLPRNATNVNIGVSLTGSETSLTITKTG
jgi:hypothetical protein